jgi:hypothetical protein
MATAEEIIREIQSLPTVDRVRIIDSVIRSTIKPDPDIEKVWVRECEARWKAFEKNGEAPIPYEDVMKKYRGA